MRGGWEPLRISEKYEKDNTQMNTHPPNHFSNILSGSHIFSNILSYSLIAHAPLASLASL